MMLQIIHQKKAAPRAFSVYCRWIRSDQGENSPLVALWIDSEMRCFEREFASDSNAELLREGALEEPGGATSFQTLRQRMRTDITVHSS